MSETRYDLIVIGAGPGGYVAALHAAHRGLKTAIVEKEAQLGGTCLRVGCIPSKAMLDSSERFHEAKHGFREHGILVEPKLDLAAMLARKTKIVEGLAKGIDGLMKRAKVERFEGSGKLLAGPSVEVTGAFGTETLRAERVLIATGSRVASLKGVEVDGDVIGTSTQALSYPAVPKHLVVIGAGAIGLELGSVWARLGSKVTVLEYLDRILPGMDKELASATERVLRKQGLELRLGVRVTGAKRHGEGGIVTLEGAEPIVCDRVLLATGRIPNTEGLGLAEAGLALDPRGRIPVNARFETALPGVYAIGDVIAGPMLAHKASEDGIACVDQMVGRYGHVDYAIVPYVVYTHPEVASVGRTEEDLAAAGVPFKKGIFQMRGLGRARVIGTIDGLVKVLAHAETDRVLGVHILAAQAGELIAEAAAAMAFGATAEDIARVCHAHPTLAEALKEAALAVAGDAIHG